MREYIKANLNAIYYDDVINTNDIPYVISIISFVLQNRKVIKMIATLESPLGTPGTLPIFLKRQKCVSTELLTLCQDILV